MRRRCPRANGNVLTSKLACLWKDLLKEERKVRTYGNLACPPFVPCSHPWQCKLPQRVINPLRLRQTALLSERCAETPLHEQVYMQRAARIRNKVNLLSKTGKAGTSKSGRSTSTPTTTTTGTRRAVAEQREAERPPLEESDDESIMMSDDEMEGYLSLSDEDPFVE